jgi:RimK family alpha-L-glutamate ligase
MQIVILNAGTGWHTDELCRALAERGHTSRVLPYEALVARLGTGRGVVPALSIASNEILDADAVLARIIPSGSLEQMIYRVDALHWIEKRGVPVMNSPRAIERSVDKFYTTALLQEAGLPTPETVVCEGTADAMAAVLALGDVIIKPIFGSMGHGMVRVNDPDVAFRVVRSLEQLRIVFYVQRAVDHGGRDIRVFVVGGRVLAAIERCAPEGQWRTNVSLGGSARPFELSASWEQLALRAAAAIGADYAGVDLLPSRDGTVFVLEVNGIPGWEGLKQATGIDVAGAIVDHLAGRVRAGDAAAGRGAELPA